MTGPIRGAAAVAAAVAVLATLAACSGGEAAGTSSPARAAPTSEAAPTGPAIGPQYVALGDSFAAAPGVPDTNGAGGCFRSSGNYAQSLAASTGLTVTDVTCSGATTQTVRRDQIPAITPRAELVTVGIGGNDFDLFTTLLGSCLELAASDQDGAPCADKISAEIDQTVPKISDNIAGLLDAITDAAPAARVVVVGYPYLLPTSGVCPALVPLAAGDYALVNKVTGQLSDVLSTQAAARGFDFVDLRAPSRGHDICSVRPWINGIEVAADGTIPFHPFGVEQQAVARIIAKVL